MAKAMIFLSEFGLVSTLRQLAFGGDVLRVSSEVSKRRRWKKMQFRAGEPLRNLILVRAFQGFAGLRNLRLATQ